MTTMKSILSRLTQAVNGTDKELFSEQELNQFASFYLDKWDKHKRGRGGRVFRGLLVEHRQGLQTMLGMRQADA